MLKARESPRAKKEFEVAWARADTKLMRSAF
jgi:hypothetical protein